MSQLSLETTSKETPEEIIASAKAWFVDEFGLEPVDEAKCCIRLEGEEGFVYISAEKSGDKTTVNLQSQGYTPQLKRFMRQVAS